jgi:hypothetical protein
LTEERKAGPQDQGFSTFFSETGMSNQIILGKRRAERNFRPGKIRSENNLR